MKDAPKHFSLGMGIRLIDDDLRAMLSGDLRRAVGTVVADDVDRVAVLRVMLLLQTVDTFTDHRFLVSRGNQHGEVMLFLTMCKVMVTVQQADDAEYHVIRTVHAHDRRQNDTKNLNTSHSSPLSGSPVP